MRSIEVQPHAVSLSNDFKVHLTLIISLFHTCKSSPNNFLKSSMHMHKREKLELPRAHTPRLRGKKGGVVLFQLPIYYCQWSTWSPAWWHRPIILALERLKQKDACSGPAWYISYFSHHITFLVTETKCIKQLTRRMAYFSSQFEGMYKSITFKKAWVCLFLFGQIRKQRKGKFCFFPFYLVYDLSPQNSITHIKVVFPFSVKPLETPSQICLEVCLQNDSKSRSELYDKFQVRPNYTVRSCPRKTINWSNF